MRRASIFLLTAAAAATACSSHPGGVGGARASQGSQESASKSASTAAASSSSSGLGAGGPTEPQCGQLGPPNGACDACKQASCCNEVLACYGEPDCDALGTCLGACTDDACRKTCYTAHPTGRDVYLAWLTCLDLRCYAVCGDPNPSSICDSGLTTNGAACDLCMSEHCCAQADACTGGKNGSDQTQVMKCLGDCVLMTPGPLCKPIFDCQAASCAADCK